jgi:hypothetical protein
VPHASQRGVLEQKFDATLAEAKARGLTSVWLLYNKDVRVPQVPSLYRHSGPQERQWRPHMAEMVTNGRHLHTATWPVWCAF